MTGNYIQWTFPRRLLRKKNRLIFKYQLFIILLFTVCNIYIFLWFIILRGHPYFFFFTKSIRTLSTSSTLYVYVHVRLAQLHVRCSLSRPGCRWDHQCLCHMRSCVGLSSGNWRRTLRSSAGPPGGRSPPSHTRGRVRKPGAGSGALSPVRPNPIRSRVAAGEVRPVGCFSQ